MNTVHESTSSTQLLEKAKRVLTPEQYERMQKKALERRNIFELSSMGLDELRAELPGVIAGDPEEQDILARLEGEFPGIRTSEGKAKVQEEKPKFTEHPWNWTKGKMQEGKEWAYEAIVPERIKRANEMSEK